MILAAQSPYRRISLNQGSVQARALHACFPGPIVSTLGYDLVSGAGGPSNAAAAAPTHSPAYGPAWEGDGSSTYVDIGTLGNFGSAVDSGWTVAFRMRYATNTSTLKRLIGVSNSGDNTIWGMNLNRDANGTLEVFVRDSAVTTTRDWFRTTATVNDGVWHSVVAGSNGDSTGRSIWIDGVSVALTDKDSDSLTSTNFDAPMYLCGWNVGGTPELTDVSLCDVRFYTANIANHIGYAYHAPATRWDLYARTRRNYFIPAGGFQPAWAARSTVAIQPGMGL